MTSTRGLGAQTQLGRRGKAQLLRRGAFRLRREAERPTTPCPTPKIQRLCCSREPRSAQQCTTGSPAHLDPTPWTLKCYYPQIASWSSAPRCGSCTPLPQPSAPVLHGHPTRPSAQPFRGPHAQRDSSPHFPEEVRSNSARLPAARALTGLRREAGGGRSELGRQRQQAGERGRRSLRTARYCFQNTSARGIPQTADEAPPPARHADGWPIVSGAPSPGLGACQGRSRIYEPSLGNFPCKGPSKILTPARNAIVALSPSLIRFLSLAPEAQDSPQVLFIRSERGGAKMTFVFPFSGMD